MHFAVIGIHFNNTPVAILGKAVFTDTGKMAMYEKLHLAGVEQAVILSTCNRSEIYFLYEETRQKEAVLKRYADFFSGTALDPYIFVKTDGEAVRYLFEVANGLHSLVLGEDQILGQIVAAEEFSRANGCSKKVMNHIFRDAVTCAKKAKTRIRISEHPLSLSFIGIKQLEKTCGIEGKKILVAGSGKMANLAMKYLFEGKPDVVYNANRGRERAESLKSEFPELVIVDFSRRYETLAVCDILIGATSSPHIVIEKERIGEREKPLYILDLALPSDIDPLAAKLKGVTLYDMHFLKMAAEENNRLRLAKAEQIRELVGQEITDTLHFMVSCQVDKTIQTLQERMEEVSGDTCAMLEQKLSLNEREKAILKKVVRSGMRRLLREPILSLKQVEEEKQDEYHEVVKMLFQIGEKQEGGKGTCI